MASTQPVRKAFCASRMYHGNCQRSRFASHDTYLRLRPRLLALTALAAAAPAATAAAAMLRLRLTLRAPPPLLSVLRHAPAERVRLWPPAWLPGRLLPPAASSPSLLPLLLQSSATASSSGGSIARLSATRLQACKETPSGW
jgi:hypothetical protein